MNQREFLIWLHARLERVHNEKDLMGYMHTLRRVIYDTPENKEIPNCFSGNSLDELSKRLG